MASVIGGTTQQDYEQARSVTLVITIDGHIATNIVEPYVLAFSYTDNAAGKADSITLELHDRDGVWADSWAPQKGSLVTATIVCKHWQHHNSNEQLPCGSFTIDTITYSGQPDKISIKAVSASLAQNLRERPTTKAWENCTLQKIAKEIAEKHNLSLMFLAEDAHIRRQDQREESDLAFLSRIAKKRGVNLKVHNGTLILFDAEEAEKKNAILVLPKRGHAFSPSAYSFTRSSVDTAYTSCTVTYRDPTTEKDIAATFNAFGEPAAEGGKNFVVNTRVESEAEARTLAQKSLRLKNQAECTGSIELMGNTKLVAGAVVMLTGFGSFSGRYFVVTATHSMGNSGYRSTAELRSVLEY